MSNFIEIKTVTDLKAIENNLSGSYILANDITLGNFSPIGMSQDNFVWGKFTGVFDGNNFVIRDGNINYPDKTMVGLFAENQGELINVRLENINVSGRDYVGVLCGANSKIIDKCYVTGSVTCKSSYTGGMSGGTFGSVALISNSFSRANVTATDTTGNGVGAGGFVGVQQSSADIVNCYSTGFVSVNSPNMNYVGGFVGYEENSIATNCYWDIDTSGQLTSARGVGLNTLEMKEQSSFTGWDFVDVWGIDEIINDGYPYLKIAEPVVEEPTCDPIIKTLFSNALVIAVEGEVPENPMWDGFVAKWDIVFDAYSYNLRLYKSGILIGNYTIDTPFINLIDYFFYENNNQIVPTDDYTFDVQSVKITIEGIPIFSEYSIVSDSAIILNTPPTPIWNPMDIGDSAYLLVFFKSPSLTLNNSDPTFARLYSLVFYKDGIEVFSDVRFWHEEDQLLNYKHIVNEYGTGNYSFKVMALSGRTYQEQLALNSQYSDLSVSRYLEEDPTGGGDGQDPETPPEFEWEYDTYYLYTNGAWKLMTYDDLNQPMRIYQINGEYELRSRR